MDCSAVLISSYMPSLALHSVPLSKLVYAWFIADITI